MSDKEHKKGYYVFINKPGIMLMIKSDSFDNHWQQSTVGLGLLNLNQGVSVKAIAVELLMTVVWCQASLSFRLKIHIG